VYILKIHNIIHPI